MAENSKVEAQDPQAKKALDVKDPSQIDDTAEYVYDDTSRFTIESYTTAIQDTGNTINPAHVSNDVVPSSSPFILKVEGTGFNSSIFKIDPFRIIASLDGYYATIPPLPDTADLRLGMAYGYVVKSDTEIWLYFDRLLASAIWFQADPDEYDGSDNPNKVAIETATQSYPYIGRDIPELDLYFIATTAFIPSPRVLDYLTPLTIEVSQTPYIITIQGHRNQRGLVPFAFQNDEKVDHRLDLFGHDLNNKGVALIKNTSKILVENPSVLPAYVLNADQSESAIRAMPLQEVSQLDYFLEGNFLEPLVADSPLPLSEYNYWTPARKPANSGKGFELSDSIPTNKLYIKTVPPGQYAVVVYDKATGFYAVAPEAVNFNSDDVGLQIHDVAPNPVILQNPSFTIRGFGFPVINSTQQFKMEVLITDDEGQLIPDIDNRGVLQVDSSITGATKNDINGRGSIRFNSSSEIVATFNSVNYLPTPNHRRFISITMRLLVQDGEIPLPVQVVYRQMATSTSIKLEAPPTIKFMTNANAEPVILDARGKKQPASKEKALVRIDQKTGQVIAYGQVGLNELYIVGQGFGSKDSVRVLFNGSRQEVKDLVLWQNDGLDEPSSAIVVKTDGNSEFKGDTTIEIRNGNISSEPMMLMPATTIIIPREQITPKPNDRFVTSTEIRTNTDIFTDNIPYNRQTQKLLNQANTKIASSIAVSLVNEVTKESVKLPAGLSRPTPITFVPDTIVLPKETPLATDGGLSIIFNVYGAFNVNFSNPKIIRLQHQDGMSSSVKFKPHENMTVVGTGFVNGMRYNINKLGWKPVPKTAPGGLRPLPADTSGIQGLQGFDIEVPDSKEKSASLQISNENADQVESATTSGLQNGTYDQKTIIVNDKTSPLFKINQRLPAGIKMYAKGPQITMTDRIDANLSIYTQMTPFLGSFKVVLIVVRIIVCIIDVICALVNPFKLIIAIIALMDCIIDLLSLFPQLAVPIMILSFLQNFVGFLQTFIQLLVSYVMAIVNSQLALLQAQLAKDFAGIAAIEQQSFGSIKQIRDVISFLEPALQVIQVFKDLLGFAMHFPCAPNQNADDECPPENMKDLIKNMVGKDEVPGKSYICQFGNMSRLDGVVSVSTTQPNGLKVGDYFRIDPGEPNFTDGPRVVESVISDTQFTFRDEGINTTSTIDEFIGILISQAQQDTLSTMFCQAVALQNTTLLTMPGFNGLDNFGNPLPGGPLKPGSTSVIPNLTPVLPDVSGAIECMNSLTDRIENALNNGQIFITTAEQGEQLVQAYSQCAQNLLDQTNQALGDICVLAVSSVNSELKVSPKGNIGPDLTDDFVKTKVALPSADPNSRQDAGLVIDLATLISPASVPNTIGTNTTTGINEATANYGLKQDIYTPIIIQTTNKSGQRQSKNTIYFNAESSEVAPLITIGDILEIVGGTFNGLQFPILGIEPIFSSIRLITKLDITAEQKLLVGEQEIPHNLSGFNVKVIAHLSGNDAVAVVPADDSSFATIHIEARDHHGHLIGPGLANKVSITIESGEAVFIPLTIPNETTDITGVIQEDGDSYIANLKSACAGTVIASASVCGVEFSDVGYHANDPQHQITTRKKTIKILFTPPIPKPVAGEFKANNRPQVPGTEFTN